MKNLISLLIYLSGTFTTFAQEVKRTFITPFVIHSVTYNASPDANECWEAVDWGIEVKDENNHLWFFSMPYEELMQCEKLIGDSFVEIEVVFWDDYDGVTTHGSVISISLKGKKIYIQ
jgi:hypothetical protein